MQLIILPQQATITYKKYWDGLSSQLHSTGIFTINQGYITPDKLLDNQVAPVFDLSDYYIIPALIDSHVHFVMPYNGSITFAEKAQMYLSAGVCAVRDAGNINGVFNACSPLIILQPGAAIYKAGFYGSSLGQGVSSMDEALHAIDKLAEQRATHIKVITSGIFSFTHFGETGSATFTTDELTQIVKHAKAYNLPVMAHASGDEAVKRCLKAGVTTIEHGYFMQEESLRELAATGTYWLPTLSPVEAQLSNPHLSKALTPVMHDVISRSLTQHTDLVATAGVLSVRIVAGTDAGSPGVEHGVSLAHEISLLHKAGLPTVTALQAATSTAASACNLPQLGSIEKNKLPFLLAVDGNPLLDPSILENPIALLLPETNQSTDFIKI